MKDLKIVIITGLSGAGKTLASKCLEDLGYFCVDNLPPILIPKFVELCAQADLKKMVLVIDIRGGEFFVDLFSALKDLEKSESSYEILFLDSSDEVLVRRFSESRRRHPLSPLGGVLEGIKAERKRLEGIKKRSHKILDTSLLTPGQFKEKLIELFTLKDSDKVLNVSVISFGYKFGIPLDADLVFDVRFLPNPYYLEKFKNLDGTSKAVQDFVLSALETQDLLKFLFEFMNFLIPQYKKEGKSHLTIGIGCTGGKHRSVIIAEELANFLKNKECNLALIHRDLQ